MRLAFAEGESWVAKSRGDFPTPLTVEAAMLRLLADPGGLPVPAVIHADDDLLIMTALEGRTGTPDADAQGHAGAVLARLHSVSRPRFGLDYDTPIGGLVQDNGESRSWRRFFRDRRLLAMARTALDRRQISSSQYGRIEGLAADLDRYIPEPEKPALIHGDLWGGNVISRAGRITGFIDPAAYFADPEIELAFVTLFGTLGAPFFDRYQDIRPIDRGFFAVRRDLYNVYPLLVHVALFGGHYWSGIERTLSRLGR